MTQTWPLLLVVLTVLVVLQHCRGHTGHESEKPADPTGQQEKFSFHDDKVIQDEAHLKEHLKEQIDTSKPMTPQEMEFHYFRLHDTDNNTKLDGLEILAALSHMGHMYDVKEAEMAGKSEQEVADLKKRRSNEATQYFADVIDKVLREDDFDQDGYISYPEYVSARRRDFDRYQNQVAEAQQMAMQQQMLQQQQMMAQQQQFQQFQQFQQQQAVMNMQQQQQNQLGTQKPPVPPPEAKAQ